MANYYDVFLSIMDDFRKYYSYLFLKKHPVDEIVREFEAEVRNISDDASFIRVLIRALSRFEDNHISLTDPSGNSHETLDRNKNPRIKNYDWNVSLSEKYFPGFPDGLKIRFSFGTQGAGNHAGALGVYQDVIFLFIRSWSHHLHADIVLLLEAFAEMVAKNPEADKLIIDVRANFGGNDKYAEALLSILVPQGQIITPARYKSRIDPVDPRKLGDDRIRSVNSHSSVHFKGQIVALIGSDCVSSNEFFVAGLKALAKIRFVKLIGDRTFGSSGNPKPFSKTLESGGKVSYMIPSWVCYDPEGNIIEGKGIAPDIFISPESTINKAQGRDYALEKAFEVLEIKKLWH